MEAGAPDGEPLDADTDRIKPDRKASGASVRVPAGAARGLVATLEQYYMLLGLTVMARNAYDGQVICAQAHNMATSLVAWAKGYPRIYNVLVTLSKGGGLLPLIMSYGGVTYAMLANHGRLGVSDVAFGAFGLPVPPPRPPSNPFSTDAYAYEPTSGGPSPLASYESSPAGTTATESTVQDIPQGVHINQAMYDRIRAEAYDKYARQQADAERAAQQEAAING